jgi:hypothetical protein
MKEVSSKFNLQCNKCGSYECTISLYSMFKKGRMKVKCNKCNSYEEF